MRDEAEVEQELVGGCERREERSRGVAGEAEQCEGDVLDCVEVTPSERNAVQSDERHIPRMRRRLKANIRWYLERTVGVIRTSSG